MQRIAQIMKLRSGFGAEYKKRHDEIWPQLSALLKEHGIEDYAIFLEEGTGLLFATLKVQDAARLNDLPAQGIMREWWDYMADIMEVNADNSPVVTSLKEVFYLP